MNRLRHYLRDDRGASAAEFALVTVPFFGLVLAIIGGAMMFYSNQSLQYATQTAARYYSVQTTNTGTAPTVAAVKTYAQNAYTGPGISPTFTPARGGCGVNGFQVTASATFPLNTGLINLSVPLKAHACFP